MLYSGALRSVPIFEHKMSAYKIPIASTLRAHDVKLVRHLRLVVDIGGHGYERLPGGLTLKERRMSALATIRDFVMHWKHTVDLEIVFAFAEEDQFDMRELRDEDIVRTFGGQVRTLPHLKRYSIRFAPLQWKEGTPLLGTACFEYTMRKKGLAWLLENRVVDNPKQAYRLHLAASLGWHIAVSHVGSSFQHKRLIPWYDSNGQLKIIEMQLESDEQIRQQNDWLARKAEEDRKENEARANGWYFHRKMALKMPDFGYVSRDEVAAMAGKHFEDVVAQD